MTRRRLTNFKSNRRGFWSLWIFLLLFFISLFAEFIANDKPVLVYYNQAVYFPILKAYPETAFGGEFQTEADYRDPFVQDLIKDNGFAIWPPTPPSGQSSPPPSMLPYIPPLGETIRRVLRLFCSGVMVCFEITVMAADAGAIPMNKNVIAIAGTHRGADTAMLLKHAPQNN